jgi:hypothetical protein
MDLGGLAPPASRVLEVRICKADALLLSYKPELTIDKKKMDIVYNKDYSQPPQPQQ